MMPKTRVVMAPGWESQVRAVTTRAVHQVTDEVGADARRGMNVDTGELRSTVRAQKLRYTGRVWVGTDHWRVIEYGTPPHLILPRRKRALYWPGAPHPVGAVMHPGTRSYAPMRKALYKKRRLTMVRV